MAKLPWTSLNKVVTIGGIAGLHVFLAAAAAPSTPKIQQYLIAEEWYQVTATPERINELGAAEVSVKTLSDFDLTFSDEVAEREFVAKWNGKLVSSPKIRTVNDSPTQVRFSADEGALSRNFCENLQIFNAHRMEFRITFSEADTPLGKDASAAEYHDVFLARVSPEIAKPRFFQLRHAYLTPKIGDNQFLVVHRFVKVSQ
jgi:hypothetical protein